AADSIFASWLTQPKFASEQILQRPEMVQILQALSQDGFQAFYTGWMAQQLVQSVQANKGIFSLNDLSNYRVALRKPLVEEHFGYRWITAPPPSAGGYTLLHSLSILEKKNFQDTKDLTTRVHTLAESWKGPFADRQMYFGDPDFDSIPLAQLGSAERIAKRANLINPQKARPASDYALPLSAEKPATNSAEHHGTSHFCVVDRQGNIAAVTTTINLAFGAQYFANGLIMNDEMDDFASSVGTANAFGLP